MNIEGDGMKIGFIGAGKVGFSLGKLFVARGVQVTGYYNRHLEEAMNAAKFTNTKYYMEIKELIDNSDVIFVTVSDGAINSVYEGLKDYDIKGKLICHASGSMTAKEAFTDVNKYNAYGYSIHPLYPVSDKYVAYEGLADAFFCIEGDEEHIEDVCELMLHAGLKVKRIGKDKVRYHAACAIASNLVCALLDESIEMLKQCGFDEGEALEAIRPLAISNMNNVFTKGVKESLTGPVERGDILTVKKHIQSFETANEKMMYVYNTLRLVQIAKRKHPDRDYSELLSVICEEIR